MMISAKRYFALFFVMWIVESIEEESKRQIIMRWKTSTGKCFLSLLSETWSSFFCYLHVFWYSALEFWVSNVYVTSIPRMCVSGRCWVIARWGVEEKLGRQRGMAWMLYSHQGVKWWQLLATASTELLETVTGCSWMWLYSLFVHRQSDVTVKAEAYIVVAFSSSVLLLAKLNKSLFCVELCRRKADSYLELDG